MTPGRLKAINATVGSVDLSEGPVAEVHPVYWVTLLTATISPTRDSLEPETLTDFDSEESYLVTQASSALEVIEWARARYTE